MERKANTREDLSATSSRNFRTFLLMAQLEAQEIGQRIARARHEAAMTQEEVADLLGVTSRSVQGYEAGEVIPYRHFQRLEEILGRSMEWFLHGEQSPEVEAAQARLEAKIDELAALLAKLDARLAELTPPQRTRKPA